MNKRRLHHYLTKLSWLKPIYLLVLTLVLGAVCVVALRSNNEQMIKLRSAVYAADKNNTDIEGSLQALQTYVTKHMNTDLSTNDSVYPPIQLKYTYSRLVQAQSNSATNANAQLYTDAQNYCQKQDSVDFSGHNRVPCIEQYVETNDAQLPAIPQSLYEFDFISPIWSPDLAGWSLIATIVSAALFILSFIASRLLRRIT